MHIALIRPWDDESIVDVQIVEHPRGYTPQTFEKEWKKCLDAVKKASPEEKEIDVYDETIKRMEKKDWRFLPVDHVSDVTY